MRFIFVFKFENHWRNHKAQLAQLPPPPPPPMLLLYLCIASLHIFSNPPISSIPLHPLPCTMSAASPSPPPLDPAWLALSRLRRKPQTPKPKPQTPNPKPQKPNPLLPNPPPPPSGAAASTLPSPLATLYPPPSLPNCGIVTFCSWPSNAALL